MKYEWSVKEATDAASLQKVLNVLSSTGWEVRNILYVPGWVGGPSHTQERGEKILVTARRDSEKIEAIKKGLQAVEKLGIAP